MNFVICKKTGCVVGGGTQDMRDVFMVDEDFDTYYSIISYDFDPMVAKTKWLKYVDGAIVVLGDSNKPHPNPDDCSCK